MREVIDTELKHDWRVLTDTYLLMLIDFTNLSNSSLRL